MIVGAARKKRKNESIEQQIDKRWMMNRTKNVNTILIRRTNM